MRIAFVSIFLFLIANTASVTLPRQNLGQDELNTVLSKTGKYCERLREAAFHFLCQETVTEISKTKVFFKKYREPGYALNVSETKNKYVNDYRIIKEDDKIIEQRKTILHNDKKVVDTAPGMKTIIRSFKTSLTPYYLFGGKNRKKYEYRLLRKEKVMKQSAYVVQVNLKKENDEFAPLPLFAVVWIDVSDFSILKFQAFPESIKGYGHLKGSEKYNVRNVEIEDIHYYNYKQKGLRFPSRTEVSLMYTYDSPGGFEKELDLTAGARMLKKIKTTFEYRKYLFFKVTVTEPVFH